MSRLIIIWWIVIVNLLKSADCNQLLDLPFEHVPFYLNLYPRVAEDCDRNPNCPLKPHLGKNVCWGYEENCGLNPRSYSHPLCDGDSRGWVSTKQEQINTFYDQGDFGYIKNFRSTLKSICTPHTDNLEKSSSSLECSEHLTFCRGRNLVIDFTDLPSRTTPVMYDSDVLKEGQIGGHCKLDKKLLKSNSEFNGSLQSWVPEIQHFTELPKPIGTDRAGSCDRIISSPTIIMKIDAKLISDLRKMSELIPNLRIILRFENFCNLFFLAVNMYHHFCDFFNLYASLHVNGTKENPDAFSRNNQIIIWRTFRYQSNFEATFRSFSKNPILDLNSFAGKKVCFKNVIFPLLPRMLFGLYYNTPLIPGCRNSGLFQAFSKFVLHRLRIDSRTEPNPKRIRITFLSRNTAYRNVLNEDALLDGLRKNSDVIVKKVNFTHKLNFLDQLRIIQETDILIGIHGAGLTHLLFLPDWAVVFELYNCEDPNCYFDLARLRGLKYLTWRDTSKLKYQDIKQDLNSAYFHKHANYIFDKTEFMKIVQEGIEYVKKEAELRNTHDEL